MEEKQFAGRLFFLDNLRCFIVLVVVVFHVALGYMGITPWWYVIDSKSYGHLYYFILLANIFMMPTLFFVAGYFALPSLERHGTTVFLKRKLMRLAIPYLICVSLVSPTFCYVRHRIRSLDSNSVPLGYWEFWLSFLKRIGRSEVHIGVQSAELAVNPYWFLLLLLLLFFVLCPLYDIGKKWTDNQPRPTHPDASSKPYILHALISVWLITSTAYYVIVVLFQWSILNMDIPVLPKFAVVSVSSVLVSYGISQFIMKRSICLTVTLVTVLHVILCIQIR